MKSRDVKTTAQSRQKMQAILTALAELCAAKYATVKDKVDIRGDISDDMLRQIAPTTNDVAVAVGNMNVYQARYHLLMLFDEGWVLKTGVSKGRPLHWWLIGVDDVNAKTDDCLSANLIGTDNICP